ncbi:MAG TPA: hypothetical protein VF691_13385 [Cytophagaceae bacterium]|jgi:hypothetical protein
MNLIINNEQVDLSEDEVLAMTYQVNDIAELKNRQASHSNQFRLKTTPKNIRLFGHSNILNSLSGIAYRKSSAIIIEDGLEIVSNGQAIVESIDENINVTIYAGIFDFFSRMGDASIRELDFSELDHVWTAEVAANSKDNTSGYIYALAQFGMVEETGYNYPINYSLPSVFVHTIINKIFSKHGFLKTGAVLQEPFFKKWAIPCNGDLKRDAKFIEDRSVYVGNTLFNYYTVGNSNQYHDRIRFDITNKGDFKQGSAQRYNAGTGGYTPDVPYIVDIEANIIFSVSVDDGKADLRVRLFKNNNEIGIGAHINQGDTDGDEITFYLTAVAENITISPGDEIWVDFLLDGEGDGFLDSYSYSWAVPEERNGFYTYFKVTPKEDFAPGSFLNLNQILPDIKQKDLVKFWAHYFGIIFQSDNYANSLDCRKFQEIADAVNVDFVDWSDKLDVSKPSSIEFRLEGYAQSNHFKYKETDSTKEVGRGTLHINDEALERETTVIEAPFDALLTQTKLLSGAKTNGLDLPIVNKWKDGGQQSIEPMIFSVDRVHIGTISYIDGVTAGYGFSNDTVPVANFQAMSFANAIRDNYQAYKRVLDHTKILNEYFNLSPIEISQLDFFKPVYVKKYSEFFYLNTVGNYVKGRSTKCTLVRL